MRKDLSDRFGAFIGWMSIGNIEWVLYDKIGAYKGVYKVAGDATYDMVGRFIGTGNLLAALLV